MSGGGENERCEERPEAFAKHKQEGGQGVGKLVRPGFGAPPGGAPHLATLPNPGTGAIQCPSCGDGGAGGHASMGKHGDE